MPVVIRLSRQGHKHLPFYRIAVADSRRASTGKFLDQLGYYNPTQNPPVVQIDEAAALKWLQNGARPSDTVRSLFHHQGLMEKLSGLRPSKKKTKAAPADAALKPRAFKAKKPKVHKVKKEALAKEKEAQAKAAAAAAKEAAAAKAAAEAAPAT